MKYWYLGAVCVILSIMLEVLEDREKIVEGVIVKAAASALFVLTGFLCAGSGLQTAFSRWILIGLCFGFAGDVVLHIRHLFHESTALFAVGTLLFAAGHVCYIIALSSGLRNLILSASFGDDALRDLYDGKAEGEKYCGGSGGISCHCMCFCGNGRRNLRTECAGRHAASCTRRGVVPFKRFDPCLRAACKEARTAVQVDPDDHLLRCAEPDCALASVYRITER